MAALDTFRRDDSFQTFKFRRDTPASRGQVYFARSYVFTTCGKVCYEICSFNDETTVSCYESPGSEEHALVVKFGWGEPASIVYASGTPAPLKTLLTKQTGSHAKILRCGSREYEWHIDVISPGECSYRIADRKDSSMTLARLRVFQRPPAPSFSLEISTPIWLHSQMCNTIIAAVVLMCKQDDPWLAGSGSGLV
ncbi:hypothetical protein BDN70DRAFT_936392 [Pholiota conissans]|uniref:Uncharacterized protein n=1 Tax=Pholiota conissans TaxID=109636 RepID=A0A9P6CPK8_9AGAR|nr:hypothetical protein BDN70DRAFT_936392 [Pholiota conissans]